MFESSNKDLLFSDDTACLANLQDETTYRKYLGPEYLMAIANMKPCLHSGEQSIKDHRKPSPGPVLIGHKDGEGLLLALQEDSDLPVKQLNQTTV